jgi:hypothetical protein
MPSRDIQPRYAVGGGAAGMKWYPWLRPHFEQLVGSYQAGGTMRY